MSEPSDSSKGTEESAPASGERMDLPKWNRARTKRKAPKGEEQDAFTGGLRGAGRRAKRHWMALVGGVGVIVAVSYGVVWWQGQVEEKAATSTRMLATAVAYEARGQVGELGEYAKRERPPPIPLAADEEKLDAKVIEALGELGQVEGEDTIVASGNLVRAQRSMRAGDHAAAETEYRTFLDGVAADHPLWFVAQEGLALALEGKGDVEGALAAFDALARDKGAFFRDQALYQKARLLESEQRGDEALAIYKQYAEEYPLGDPSLAREAVRERLTELDPSALTGPAPEPAVQVIDGAGTGG